MEPDPLPRVLLLTRARAAFLRGSALFLCIHLAFGSHLSLLHSGRTALLGLGAPFAGNSAVFLHVGCM